MSQIVKKFMVNGVLADATSLTLRDPTGAYGVQRNDTGTMVVPPGTAMTRTGLGTYEYEFTDPVAGLSYTYWVEAVYEGETLPFEGRIESPIASPQGLTRNGIMSRIRGRFAPVTMATPDGTLKDILLDAVLMFNTWRGIKRSVEVHCAPGQGYFNIPAGIKTILRLNPILPKIAYVAGEIGLLLGVSVIPRPDQILDWMYQWNLFKEQKRSLGLKFDWKVANGKVFYGNLNQGAQGVEVVGLAPIDVTTGVSEPGDFLIGDEDSERWILEYSHALAMENEARLLRKGRLVGAAVDATDLMGEATTKKAQLERELKAGTILAIGR